MSDLTVVTYLALLLAVVSFAIYLWTAKRAIQKKSDADSQVMALKGNLHREGILPSADDIVKVTNAFTALLAGLASAGPAATSLLASIAFLLIAATSAGAFRQPPSDKPPVQKSAPLGNGGSDGTVGHDTTLGSH